MLAIEKNEKKRKQYYCEKCDYVTCKKTDYERHCETIKHKNSFLAMEIDDFSMDFAQKTKKEHFCECGKVYKDNSGLLNKIIMILLKMMLLIKILFYKY